MRILIVEDLVDQAEALSLCLKQEGHIVHLAGDGNQGLAQLAVHGADAVVLDVAMPGMTGAEFLTRLRAESKWANLPVVVSTGLAPTTLDDLGLPPGTRVLTKPWSVTELLAVLYELVRPLPGESER